MTFEENEVPWSSTTLNKGKWMRTELNGHVLSVGRVDRRIDPFLAGVEKNGVLLMSGLFPTLGKARMWCKEKANG